MPSGLACDAVQEVTHRLLGQLRHGIFGGYADYMVIAFIYRQKDFHGAALAYGDAMAGVTSPSRESAAIMPSGPMI